VVSLAHPGGLHTSYEPVRAAVRVGQLVDATTVIGELLAGHPGCGVPACLHWGAMWGPAARADYVDPLGLLESTPIRLKPLHG
jgi:murein DD-endopeptidase MepM/ murein hydrolase activator NlpD